MTRHFAIGLLLGLLLAYLYATKRAHTEPAPSAPPPDRYDKGRYLQRGQGGDILKLDTDEHRKAVGE